jgi:multidrug efflux pump subunit AcrA (membrane-fusion protein)
MGRTGYTGPSIRIPVSSLGADVKQKAYVFVFNPETQLLEKRFVQTENVINNEVIISKGLNDNEIIATAGIAFLRDGQKVSLLDNAVQRFN